MSIFQFSLVILDSLLAVFFLMRDKGYKWNDKPQFLMLFPILLMNIWFYVENVHILVITGSIFVSYLLMIILKFECRTKIGLLWSCILYFGTLMLSSSMAFVLFLIFMNKSLDFYMIPQTFNVLLCLILKSYLWGIVRFYIFLEERNIMSKNDNIQPMISNSIYNIAFIVVILYAINNDILKERHGFVLLIIGIVTSQVIFFYMYAKMNSKSRLFYVNDLLMQIHGGERYLKGNNQQVERMARINHDIKNHLTYIAYNLENKNYDKAKEYIVELINNADLNYNFIKLTDISLNFIINHKLSQAYRKNIKIFAQIEDIKNLYLEEFDLCILLCNILDNAIEAVEGQEEKQIHIEIFNHAGYQTYFIKNTIETSILGVNSNLVTTKYNKKDHGYGFLQINDIINKYHGHIDIYELERFFCIKILIPAS